jgi:hypothetical protein
MKWIDPNKLEVVSCPLMQGKPCLGPACSIWVYQFANVGNDGFAYEVGSSVVLGKVIDEKTAREFHYGDLRSWHRHSDWVKFGQRVEKSTVKQGRWPFRSKVDVSVTEDVWTKEVPRMGRCGLQKD